ncbi:O-antigen ligase family protein [Streptomyces massasporeus]|uniref:O-antigen ligase family protein n=1 Tax=Streptomyces massasporeus TaxID=67324 RepID=UPI0033DECC64
MTQTLFLGLALFAVLLWIFTQHCNTAIGLLLGVQVWAIAAGGETPFLDVGFSVLPSDLLAACAVLVAGARLLRRGAPPRAELLLVLAVMCLIGWSLQRGVGAFGLTSAANDARVYFWQFFASALYVATAPLHPGRARAVVRLWLVSAAAYAALSLAGWLNTGLHSVVDVGAVGQDVYDPRPVPARSALVLAQSVVLLLCSWGGNSSARTAEYGPGGDRRGRQGRPAGSRWRILPALLCLVFVVLLQHRTVWAITLVMAVVWWALAPSRAGQRLVSAAAALVSLCVVMLTFATGMFGGVGSVLADSFAETQDEDSTFAWRVHGWQELMDGPKTLAEWLLGSPFGSGYDRWVGGVVISVSPHDYYLHVVLRLGVVGLLTLLAAYFLVWRRLDGGGNGTPALRLMVVSHLVLFVSYSPFPEQGVLLGLCLWQLRADAAGRSDGGPRNPLVARQQDDTAQKPTDREHDEYLERTG